MKKIAVVVGHTSAARGAVRVTDQEPEFLFNSRLALSVVSHLETLGVRGHVFYRRPDLSYARQIKDVYGETDAWGATATVELHFNSFHTGVATGTETLSSGTKGSLALCRSIQAEMVKALGLADRGVKVVKRNVRGGESLWAGRAPAALLEPFFGSNTFDCARVDGKFNELAAAIAKGSIHV